jgi:hypothetical protein
MQWGSIERHSTMRRPDGLPHRDGQGETVAEMCGLSEHDSQSPSELRER